MCCRPCGLIDAEARSGETPADLLPGGGEQVIPAEMPQDEIVRRVMADSGLATEPTQEDR